ncbi:MAG: hydroxyethylthiazole kinase [Haloquadratum sp.]|jgi:hydroxyethylthiazole kinase|nr:hydroxyethylthiazole kinase [Haloferacaceae archaeon]MDR9445105.1 hydroxyethylthiazole kinase [Haloquadratum sp.]
MTSEAAVDALLGRVVEEAPLVESVTNAVTVADVAAVIRQWGALPVMADDTREIDAMVGAAEAVHLNMGTVDVDGEAALVTAMEAAAAHDVPSVFDPVGVGATPTRTAVATAVIETAAPTIIKGNHAEISALAGADAEVRGVESVGTYAAIGETAQRCAEATDAVVVASGETDVVATADRVVSITGGDPMLGRVVGTGCMLGASLAAFVAVAPTPLEAAVAGTVAFGRAAELAMSGRYGPIAGPASFKTRFIDAVAGMREVPIGSLEGRLTEGP